MTVEQNVAFGLEMKGVSRQDIARRTGEALELVRLPHLAKRYPKQMSGGQQQRVALARALVNRPKVLLLDEPLGALDMKLRKEMQIELKTLQQEVGITFVYVTHDQEEALTMSDRIAVMSHGQALQVGSPLEIYERPNCRFVADFIGETNFLEGRVTAVNGDFATLAVDGGRAFVGRAGEGVRIGDAATLSDAAGEDAARGNAGQRRAEHLCGDRVLHRLCRLGHAGHHQPGRPAHRRVGAEQHQHPQPG